MNLEHLEKGQGILWYPELAFWLTLWKQSDEYCFLKECPSQVLQQKLRDPERAFRDSFDRSRPMKRLPVFKRKGRGDGIRFPQGFKIDNRRIFLPKTGWVGFYKSCSIKGKVKNITISQRGNSGNLQEKRKDHRTGRNRSKKYRVFIIPLPMYVQTFFTNKVPRSAKTTLRYLSRN